MNFIISTATDIGTTKATNQDSFNARVVTTPLGRMAFAVVCDGMGGLDKGEVASASVVNAFCKWAEQRLPDLCESGLTDSAVRADWVGIATEYNEKIKLYGKRCGLASGLGTTVTALLLTEQRYYIINVGDTRAYEIGDHVVLLTKDQTVVAREVELGNLTQVEAETDPRRSVLLQCVGASDEVYPDMFFGDPALNATYMLCSDGFRHEITEREIYAYLNPTVMTDADGMQRNMEALIELNKQRREHQNILKYGGNGMLEIGSLVDGKYKILNKVGQGGMSVVYMAINEKANKTWAVKEVRKDGVLNFESVKQGLVAETNILKKLSHPNLPSIIDVIDTEDSFIIIMDYVQGNSLNKALEEYGAQPQEYVIEWAKQLCDVLGYLHSRQPPIIYRDMKPANIMLKPDGNVTLIDFGTAREFKEKNLADTTCLGTVGYAAPEQFGGMGQTDARTDIYCLGATLYHLVTGCNPSEPPYEMKPIREINPSLSGGLERIILKCTQRNPEDRYQSAAELMYALDHYKEIDEDYKKKQKRKLAKFIVPTALAVVFAVAGFALSHVAAQQATDTYRDILYEASKTADYGEKVALYGEAIAVPDKAGEKDAYLALIQTYKDNDSRFSVEEANQLTKYIKSNKAALQADPANYTEICFETGKLYWYYYDYGDGTDNQVTRAKSAVEWFQDVLDNAPEGYANLNMARVYVNIGSFYRDITTDITEASDKGKYKPFFDNIRELLDTVATDENESEIVRLELLELSRSALQQYATKFKGDGISQADMMQMYDQVERTVTGISATADTTEHKKEATVSLLADTKKAIETAYATKGGKQA